MGKFKKGKSRSIAKSHRTDLVICSQSREGKTMSDSWINTVNIKTIYKVDKANDTGYTYALLLQVTNETKNSLCIYTV